ncbi:M42 family metallopeptidase [Tumebacillus permanentifrigoris]|uniref:Endoglucanase n=1 Tax=Tumebacillus permanentifrigoris TaxID=378543 RepID=A0A316D8D1_9BACL|nr:M42 family peptidase [Tumebacillus permanentifrigoris]PWK06618.1 endoglucanase [Tumebacillus permanentifrigoris]
MKELLISLSEASGPWGREENVRAILKEAVAPYADTVQEDVLGNLIVTKKGTADTRKQLLLVAHMDEPGLLVNHIESDGFLRIQGHMEPAYLVGQRIEFPNGTIGVVFAESYKDPGSVTHNGLFVDIGATSYEEAAKKVRIGDIASLSQHVLELAPDKLIGKAMDNRAGCAAAVDVLKHLGHQAHDVTVVFSTQDGVGSRGIKPAAFGVEPDFGLVLDAVRTGDTPGAGRIEVKLGKGVAVKLLDKNFIVPPRIKDFLLDEAAAAGLAHQLEVYPEGSNDCGALLSMRDGIPTGGLSIPVRYSATGSEMVDLGDVETAAKLALAVLTNYSL